MEKISSIIASSPRVSAVDLKESGTARPGSPTFGRPEGVATQRDSAPPVETARRANGAHQTQMDWRSKESHQAAIAADMSNKFFMKAKPEPVEPQRSVAEMPSQPAVRTSQAPVESRPSGFKTDEFGSLSANSVRPEIDFKVGPRLENEAPMMKQPEGLYPKGYFLNRTA